jgi:hypothetical protein
MGASSVKSRFEDCYFLLLKPRTLRVAADEYDPSGVLGIVLRHSVSPAHRRGADRAANRFTSGAPDRHVEGVDSTAILDEVGGLLTASV